MKKIVSIILCLTVMAASLVSLSGCGKTASGDTLIWYVCADKPSDFDQVLEKANAEIIEPAIGMKLDMRFIDTASYAEKMKLKMASGEVYDLCFTGYINDYQTAVSLGGLKDITKYIDEEGLKDIIPEFYLDSAKVDGKIYGIPNIQVVSNPPTLFINKTLSDKVNANLDEISKAATTAKSHEDIVKYAGLLDNLFEKVHKASPEQYTFNPVKNIILEPRYENVLGNIYILKDGTSNKLMLDYDIDDWQFGTQKLNEWYNKGYIRSDIASKGTAVSGSDEARQIAVRADSWKPGWDVTLQKTYNDVQDYGFISNPYIARTNAIQTMISVGGNTKNPKKAVEFIKLINTNKDLYNMLIWGIKDVHYELDEQGRAKTISDSGFGKLANGGWKFGNQFNSYVTTEQDLTIWEETEKMNNEAKRSPMLGFVPNTDDISNELANISNVMGEFNARASFGTESPDKWMDDYKSKLKAAGCERVLEELQKQYDEFLASNK